MHETLNAERAKHLFHTFAINQISRPPPRCYALNELPQPHVDLVFGFENLKPEPSIDST